MLQYPPSSLPMQRKWKSNVEIAPNCPRCASPNTKFCYYNNYSLSQPRYFCKGCRRYWTKGGSLRNVPFGGGCRKNHRAKSAKRFLENEPVSVNYSKSFSGSGDNRYEHSANAFSSDDGGSDIDLAVVFAKFLNESSSSEPDFVSEELANVPNTSTPVTVQNDHGILVESQNPSDHHLVIEDANLLEEFPQVFDIGEKQQEDDHQRVEDFLENDMNSYGLQTLLSDEIVQDVLWTDAAAENLPNFTWLQDFDSYPADGQLKSSANLINDNWNSFDLSGFEVNSRP